MKIGFAPSAETVAYVANYAKRHAAEVHALNLEPNDLEVKVGLTPDNQRFIQVVGRDSYWTSVNDGPTRHFGTGN